MPQRDVYHEAVKQALIDDGWTITHDPYYITFGERRGFVDLGAERPELESERTAELANRQDVGDVLVVDVTRPRCVIERDLLSLHRGQPGGVPEHGGGIVRDRDEGFPESDRARADADLEEACRRLSRMTVATTSR